MNRVVGRRSSSLVVALVAVACAASRPPEPVVPIERDLALETFDTAWRLVNETHFDTTFNGVDWWAVREELRPRAAGAATRAELRTVLRDMVGRLGQSHFAIIPAEAVDALDPADSTTPDRVGDVGLDVRFLDGHVVVTWVDPAGPAGQAGVRPGWIVRRVDDRRLDEAADRFRARPIRIPLADRMRRATLARLGGERGTDVRVTFLDERDRPVVRPLTRRRGEGEPVKFGNLPTFFASLRSRRDSTEEGHAVGVVWFSNWMVPLVRRFDGVIDEFRRLDGIVIDLRGNPGGVGAMVMGVAGHFFADRVTLGEMRTRTASLKFVTNPRRVSTTGEPVRPYAGPVALLIDATSGSASEVFAGGMQSVGRVRVFGETSFGAVLPAVMDRLPNEDVLYHAIGEFSTAKGDVLEGRGVVPDAEVRLTRGDLLAGRDPAMEAALRWIAEQSWSAVQAPQLERSNP